MNVSEVTHEQMFLVVFPAATILLTLGLIGIYGHCHIIYATFKYKFLHSPCFILIAMLAFGDLIHQMSHFTYASTVYSGNILISHRTCFWLQLVPAFFMLHSIVIILILGVDRLYCVIFPVMYHKTHNSVKFSAIYLLLVNIPPGVYAAYLCFLSYNYMIEDPERGTVCIIVGFFSLETMDMWANSTVLFSALSAIIYIIIWIIVWKRTNVSTSTKNSMKPLTVVLILTIVGWFMGMLTVSVMNKLNLPEQLLVGLSSYAGVSINASISANYFVYKYFGSDYRRAFDLMWGKKPDPNQRYKSHSSSHR